MNRILIKPARRLFTRRLQWTFEWRGANGEKISDQDTYNNRPEASKFWEDLLALGDPVELVIYDRHGVVESRRQLR